MIVNELLLWVTIKLFLVLSVFLYVEGKKLKLLQLIGLSVKSNLLQKDLYIINLVIPHTKIDSFTLYIHILNFRADHA